MGFRFKLQAQGLSTWRTNPPWAYAQKSSRQVSYTQGPLEQAVEGGRATGTSAGTSVNPVDKVAGTNWLPFVYNCGRVRRGLPPAMDAH